MTRKEQRILIKAQQILDLHTDEPKEHDLRLIHKMNEAYDTLSGVIYFLERNPEQVAPSPSWLAAAWESFCRFFLFGRFKGDL